MRIREKKNVRYFLTPIPFIVSIENMRLLKVFNVANMNLIGMFNVAKMLGHQDLTLIFQIRVTNLRNQIGTFAYYII